MSQKTVICSRVRESYGIARSIARLVISGADQDSWFERLRHVVDALVAAPAYQLRPSVYFASAVE